MSARPALTALALAALALVRPAWAQQEAPQQEPTEVQLAQSANVPQVPPNVQELYQEALQSIAEGRKQDANRTLQRVIEQEPLHAGAWLDLALIQCSLGRPTEAERMFRTIEERFDPPPGITDLIREARQQGCDNWTPLSHSSISLSRGIDQNVNQGSTRALSPDYTLSPEFLPQHDQYTLLSADYLRDLTPNGTLGLVQVQWRRNDNLRDYDSGAAYAGLESAWRWGGWTLRTTALAGAITLGGHYYQRQYQVLGRLGLPYKLPGDFTMNLHASVGHNSYITLDTFDANTAELRAQFTRRKSDHVLHASVGVANDHATSNRPGGNRHGVNAMLSWQRRYASGFTGELAYTLQHWRGSSAYAPGVIDQVREQDMHTLRGSITYPVSRGQNLILEVRQVYNKENIPIFQYNNRQLQLSWQWQGL
ncbi:tetratricopeptide repeat protein [Pseudoduganella sp. OTU4001]|uniref:tetratricopeptide repeat protein n=1 Tax=Pseudoduganella sp. OTU4001 TaxID=3043854 RepID=UPI00313E6D29